MYTIYTLYIIGTTYIIYAYNKLPHVRMLLRDTYV